MDRINVDELCGLVVKNFKDGHHKTYQALSEDDGLLRELADHIEEKIGTMDDNYRLLRVDLNDYAGYDDMIEDLVRKIFADTKFDPKNTRMKLGGDGTKKPSNKPEFKFNNIMKKDFPNKHIFALMIIEHYERASQIWDSTAFGNLRAMLCDSPNTSIVVMSSKEMKEVSELPVGSSPLYNIFTKIMKVER